jgi:hypothetical protein
LNGESSKNIAKEIRAKKKLVSKYRSIVIARTETHSVYNHANNYIIGNSVHKYVKE